MARIQLQRCVWLLEYLLRKGRASWAEICEAWEDSSLGYDMGAEYSKRTFYRDKNYVQELFDVDIECESAAPYRHYVKNREGLEGDKLRSWLLSTLSTFNVVSEGRSLSHRLLVEAIPKGDDYLRDIILAMKRGLRIQVGYASYWKPDEQELLLDAYAVKSFRRRWYLLARPSGGTYPKIYALDRICRLSLTEESYQMPKDFDAEDYFHSSFGIMVDEEYPVEEIRLRAYGVRINYMDSLPLHHSQRKQAEGEGWAEYTLRLRASIDFQQELMSCAQELEVLSPDWLRRDIAGCLSQALGFYR